VYIFVSDIAVFVLKRDVKLQLSNYVYFKPLHCACEVGDGDDDDDDEKIISRTQCGCDALLLASSAS